LARGLRVWCLPMAIDGNPRTKGLRRKARTLEQAAYKDFTIDFGVDVYRPTHEYTPLENQAVVSATDIHLTMTNPRIFDN
jgi:hypothetical protein